MRGAHTSASGKYQCDHLGQTQRLGDWHRGAAAAPSTLHCPPGPGRLVAPPGPGQEFPGCSCFCPFLLGLFPLQPSTRTPGRAHRSLWEWLPLSPRPFFPEPSSPWPLAPPGTCSASAHPWALAQATGSRMYVPVQGAAAPSPWAPYLESWYSTCCLPLLFAVSLHCWAPVLSTAVSPAPGTWACNVISA